MPFEDNPDIVVTDHPEDPRGHVVAIEWTETELASGGREVAALCMNPLVALRVAGQLLIKVAELTGGSRDQSMEDYVRAPQVMPLLRRFLIELEECPARDLSDLAQGIIQELQAAVADD